MIAKRIMDVCLTIPGIVLLSPLMLLIAIVIKFESKGPVLFRQVRIGRFGRPFKIMKFRSMTVANNTGPNITAANDQRITRLGRVLRKYKLDEFPQLFNVLLGEMSLVGPRPEVPEYVVHYSDASKKIVFSVPPGLTDFAAIEFRNESELLDASVDPAATYVADILPKKIEYYEKYVAERSLLLDIRLILKTLVAIARH
ncbi:MAG: sugar transferase [Woeseiaceae bacterium]